MTTDVDEYRRQRLAAAVEKCGSQAELGRRLGLRSGAMIRQMLAGERPITEKTIARIERIWGMQGWFGHAKVTARESPAPSLGQALALIESALRQVPTAEREAVAVTMAGWARDGGAEHWRRALLQLLYSEKRLTAVQG